MRITFDDQPQCEEYYVEEQPPVFNIVWYFTDRLYTEAHYRNGKLIRAVGWRVHAEIIELNIVKFTRPGFPNPDFMQLCDDVRWLELGDLHLTEE